MSKNTLLTLFFVLLLFIGCGGGSGSDSSSQSQSSSSLVSQGYSSTSSQLSSVSSSTVSSIGASSSSSSLNISIEDYNVTLVAFSEDGSGFSLRYRTAHKTKESIALHANDKDKPYISGYKSPSVKFACKDYYNCGTEFLIKCDYYNKDSNGTDASCTLNGEGAVSIHFAPRTSVQVLFHLSTAYFNCNDSNGVCLGIAQTSGYMTDPITLNMPQSQFSSSVMSQSQSSTSSQVSSASSSSSSPLSVSTEDYNIALTSFSEDRNGFALHYRTAYPPYESVTLYANDKENPGVPKYRQPSITFACKDYHNCGTDFLIKCDYYNIESNGTDASCTLNGEGAASIRFAPRTSVQADFKLNISFYRCDDTGYCFGSSWWESYMTDPITLNVLR